MTKTKSELIKNNAVIEGFDSAGAIEWCTPSFMGCSMCISAAADDGKVSLSISLKTPFGNVSKTFDFDSDVSFTWNPFSRFKITVGISGFTIEDASVSFNLSVKPCVDVPILGWKCFSFEHHFVIPTELSALRGDMDDSTFSSLMALHNSGAMAYADMDNRMLEGDIYNAYLKGQNAAFPTIPVVSCIKCTDISPICAAPPQQQQGNVGFPTIPVVSCIKCTDISPICATPPQQQQGNVGFPTIPVVSCIKCTDISPICAAPPQQQHGNVGFPTIPVVSCIKCTDISPICAAPPQQQSGNVGFPTIPVVSCIKCTDISPICMA